jgi:hypothetical protein
MRCRDRRQVSKLRIKDPDSSMLIAKEMEITVTLRGKWALVTGASRGIGAAIAKTHADEGADAAITYEDCAERRRGRQRH